MTIIKTNQITRAYGTGDLKFFALNGVDLEIEEGEFTSIVGPSGSGKTTLLNVIGGLDTCTGGSVILDGVDITKLSDNEMINFRLNKIGFVFQAYNLIPVLTAEENVEFIMLLQKRPKEERKKRAYELLLAVGLGERMHHRPTEMSGGQQQRVAVARALASRPKFILADEPTANLDSTSTTTLLDIMSDLNKNEGITFIFSTHDKRVIDKARRVIKLVDGRVDSDIRV